MFKIISGDNCTNIVNRVTKSMEGTSFLLGEYK